MSQSKKPKSKKRDPRSIQEHFNQWNRGDEPKIRKGAQKKKQPKKNMALPIPLSETNATVIEVHPKLCRVLLDEIHEVRLCSYRRSQVFQAGEIRERSPVTVGDRVRVEVTSPQDGMVVGLAERKNQLSRKAPGREQIVHTLAANLDRVVVVSSIKDPEFSPGLVDRFLVACTQQNIPVTIVVNKIDLVESQKDTLPVRYSELGYEVLFLSAKKKTDLGPLIEKIKNQRTLFCGHSGVGKTKLLSAIVPDYSGRVGSVNPVTGKGKHTTTGATLLHMSQGEWIDTPGIRAFSLTHIQPGDLHLYFPEFKDDDFDNEGQWINQKQHEIAKNQWRYSSYLRVLESLLEE